MRQSLEYGTEENKEKKREGEKNGFLFLNLENEIAQENKNKNKK